jgi:hypothetical protein
MQRKLKQLLARYSWQAREVRRRYATAWRYAHNRITVGDGWDMLHAAENRVGAYALEYLDESSVLESAYDRYGPNPEIDVLVTRACQRVAHKWNSTGDLQGAAEDWAFKFIATYAADDGIVLEDSWSLDDAA